ncbi:MAG: response regulator transcription factor [Alicyclobacillus herbarius]|uniref:helix-turn-helix domain-containing protein n=1 Tax=Alicyclobacillus TaxID=29330 RepID=UPI00040415B8|nr:MULTISPECIES: response regulator transcription factor [Alicyclobacillus]MCL6625809.1 response regulator transcription factor [Alicyclobacillus shizuokensis]MCL6633011.1 response regulator transcription factor [Alicyclobacillus herbarius]
MSGDQDMRTKSLLTNREREVFELLVQDKTTKEIAAQLFVSEKTVRNHISNVMKKLNVKGRSQAVVELVRLGEITI